MEMTPNNRKSKFLSLSLMVCNKPIISVIIPVYDGEKFINKAIHSVLNQSLNNNLYETIVINDGSIDRTEEEVLIFKDSIKYISLNKNSGRLYATCVGILEAKGEFLAFLDADDLWKYNKLELVIKKFYENENAALIAQDYEYINEEGYKLEIANFHREKYNKIKNLPDEIKKRLMKEANLTFNNIVRTGGSGLCVSTKFLDKEKFYKFVNMIPLDIKRNMVQDATISIFSMIQPNAEIDYIDNVLYSYRLHQSSGVGNQVFTKDIQIIKKSLENIIISYNYLLENLIVHFYPQLVKQAIDNIKSIKYRKELLTGKKKRKIISFFIDIIKCSPQIKKISCEFIKLFLNILLGNHLYNSFRVYWKKSFFRTER